MVDYTSKNFHHIFFWLLFVWRIREISIPINQRNQNATGRWVIVCWIQMYDLYSNHFRFLFLKNVEIHVFFSLFLYSFGLLYVSLTYAILKKPKKHTVWQKHMKRFFLKCQETPFFFLTTVLHSGSTDIAANTKWWSFPGEIPPPHHLRWGNERYGQFLTEKQSVKFSSPFPWILCPGVTTCVWFCLRASLPNQPPCEHRTNIVLFCLGFFTHLWVFNQKE